MFLLRRVLKIQSALWALTGLALGLVPLTVLEALGQSSVEETAWLRMLGVTAVVLALLMWLVAGALDQVWWWAWAFAVLEAGVATLALVNATFSVDPGAPAWAWWVIGGVSVALAALDLVGLGRTSQEKPQV